MKKSVLLMFAIMAMVLSGCSSDDDENNSIVLDSKEVVIYSGDKYQIEAKSDKSISYQSEDEYHARVSTSGLISANKVGETNILLNNGYDSKTVKVIVKGKINLYPEPYLKWNVSKNELIKLLGKPDKESLDAITYNNYSSTAPSVIYMFNENNTLKGVGVLVRASYSSQLGTFLAERYFAYQSQDYTIYFVNNYSPDLVSMGVGAMLYNTSYWIVAYAPFNAKTKSMQFTSEDFVKEINKIIR